MRTNQKSKSKEGTGLRYKQANSAKAAESNLSFNFIMQYSDGAFFHPMEDSANYYDSEVWQICETC